MDTSDLQALYQITEDDIRRVLTSRSLSRARSYYRAGRVLNPRLEDGVLRAEVQGSDYYPYDVKVWVENGRIMAECTCPYDWGGYCKHIGAVLLAWLHEPDTFAGAQPRPAVAEPAAEYEARPETTAPDRPVTDQNGESQTRPEQDFAGLLSDNTEDVEARQYLIDMLSACTVKELRAIAKRRGFRLRGTAKGPIVEQLADYLSDPTNVIPVLEAISPLDLDILTVIHIIAPPDTGLSAEAIYEGLHLLGHKLSLSELNSRLAEMGQQGIIISFQGQDKNTYHGLPVVVRRHLPLRPELVPAYPPDRQQDLEMGHSSPAALFQTVVTLWQYLAQRATHLRPPRERTPVESQYESLRGWEHIPAELVALQSKATSLWSQFQTAALTVPPARYALTDEDLQQLQEQTGATPEILDFLYHLLQDLGLVLGKPGQEVSTDPRAMQRFLGQGQTACLRALARAWQRTIAWSEMDVVLRHVGQLRLRRQARFAHFKPKHLREDLAEARRFLVRIIGLLEENRWYSFQGLLDRVRTLERDFLHGLYAPIFWWLESDISGRRFDPKNDHDWQIAYGSFISAVVEGPLAWLGAVELGYDERGLAAFRLTPLGSHLLGRRAAPISLEAGEEVEKAEVEEGPTLVLADDLTATVRLGQPMAELYDLLGVLCELEDVSPHRFRYRLTAASAQRAFEAGWDLPAIVEKLESFLGHPLPASWREALEGWAANYGLVHLYNNLAVLELADDYALQEVLACTSLGDHIVYQFSPRLVVIEPEAVDTLVAELQKKGYTPRVE